MDNSQIEPKPKKSKSFLFLLIGILLGIVATMILIYFKNDLFSFLIKEECNNEPQKINCPICPTCPICNNDNNDLDVGFLQMEYQNQNMIYSPLSIKTGLMMLRDGANGHTKEQIDNVLDTVTYHQYDNIKDKVSFANALFIQTDAYVKDEYKNTIKNNYSGEVVYDSFKTPDNVNNWISDKTFNLIKNFFDKIEARAILVNTLAIDVGWKYNFDSENTNGGTFYKSDGSKMTATTMSNMYSNGASYYQDNSVSVVSLPLEELDGTSLEYIAIMPSNLEEWVKGFSVDSFNELTNKLQVATSDKRLSLQIPKYKYEYELDFKKDLINLGVTDVFSPSANLSNINEDFYVDDARHKAVIEFSEKGIKAAAITEFSMKDFAAFVEYDTINININKPFMYIIRDSKTEDIWFIGTVNEPNNWNDDYSLYGKAK